MLIGIIALGINLTEIKAEEVTAQVTTAPQETTTAPETTTPAVTTPQETTTKVEQPTTVQPTTKPDVDTTGKNVKKGGYVKKTVTAYNLKVRESNKSRKRYPLLCLQEMQQWIFIDSGRQSEIIS